MLALVVVMLLSVALAVIVVAVVAIPARREGRDMLTPKGEKVVTRVRDKTGSAVGSARGKSGLALGAAREKVAEVSSSKEH